jgi:hypothetical protein
MKTKLLLLLALLSLAIADVSQADGRRWRGDGDWDGGRRWRGGGDWDGGRRWRGDWDGGRRWRGDWDGGRRWRGDWDGGRRWRGDWDGGRRWRGGGYWGPYWRGGWGPAFGVRFVVPVPVFGGVYVRRPAPSYVTYAQPILARAQARLARLGYYPGPIDGDFGPITSRAIRSYQLDYGLPVTGRLDYRTRASLGL